MQTKWEDHKSSNYTQNFKGTSRRWKSISIPQQIPNKFKSRKQYTESWTRVQADLQKEVVECWKGLLLSKISRSTKHNNGETPSFRRIVNISSKRFAFKTISFLDVPRSWFHLLKAGQEKEHAELHYNFLYYILYWESTRAVSKATESGLRRKPTGHSFFTPKDWPD